MSNTNQKLDAPYNFVPLSDTVFFPDWHDQVSHDVPFEDGLSGSFDLTIEAKTPIFTRDDDDEEAFLNVDGTPFIKGSSIRGMLREAVKIAAFGKMDTADDRHFAFREFGDASYRNMMKSAKPGWLTPDQTIEPCSVARISYDDLEAIQRKRGNQSWSRRDAMPKKYERWEGTRRQHAKIIKGKNDTFAVPVDGTEPGSQEGRLVFTGHVDNKKREFFYYDRRPSDAHPVSDEVYRKFKQAHRASQQRPGMDVAGQKPNKHWGYHKKKNLEDDQPVPVFYRTENGEVTDLGLASMYRLPSKVGVHGAIANRTDDHLDLSRFDLADLLFGYAADEDDNRGSLKGRVSIAHASLDGETKTLPPVTAALQTPKASFYPAYLEQNRPGRDGLNSWQDSNATISGWKRYPARGTADPDPDTADGENMNTVFKPLDSGSKFQGRVYFHNLRPVELGALLWILDFGGHIEGLVHRLGLARPYGYGEVSLSADNLKAQPNAIDADEPDADELRRRFEALMEETVGSTISRSWLTSEPIVHLLAMANPEHGDPKRLQYEPGPGSESGDDGFSDAKRDGTPLPPPDGIEATREKLQAIVEKHRERQRQAQRRVWEQKPATEQADKVVDAIEREEDAVQVARVIIHHNDPDQLHQLDALSYRLEDRYDQWLRQCLECDERREALRQALYDSYYPFWAKGKEATAAGVQAGADKLREYASWLEADDDDGSGGSDGAGEEEPSGPFGHLPGDEGEALAKIMENEHPTGPFKNLWHNSNDYKEWSPEGLEALAEVAHQALVGDKPMRKVKRKDKKLLADIEEFVEKRLEELSDQSDDDGLDEPSESSLEEPSTV